MPHRKFLLLTRYVASFSKTKSLLKQWWSISKQLPSKLQEQAQASLKLKAFHCIGGSIYALYPDVNHKVMLQAIVALQTISDYLDNLCDRMRVNDDQAFRQLHLSFTEALDPNTPLSDYYRYYPYQEGIYLKSLVDNCREAIRQMPYYRQHQSLILQLASYYCELQILKHLQPDGELRLKQWINNEFKNTALGWNEWAAATGSTLGIFMLFAASFHEYSPSVIGRLYDAYFPWIQALHIQLDYFIDGAEDKHHGDLNFTFYYKDQQETTERLGLLFLESKKRIGALPYPFFHELVIQGLISLYGSDPKVQKHNLLPNYQLLFNQRFTTAMYKVCLFLRNREIIV